MHFPPEIERDHEAVVARKGLEGEGLVGEMQDARLGPMQPGMTAAHPDQLLMAAKDLQPGRRQRGWAIGEGRTDGVVAAEPVLLDAAEGLLVAGVDRGRAAAGEQDRQRVIDEARVIEAAGEPRYVVIADKCLGARKGRGRRCAGRAPKRARRNCGR